MNRYLELLRIQHVFHTYTPENVYVNIFCNYAGCQVHGSSLPAGWQAGFRGSLFPDEVGIHGFRQCIKVVIYRNVAVSRVF